MEIKKIGTGVDGERSLCEPRLSVFVLNAIKRLKLCIKYL